jgi:hypothetical protein
MKSEIQLAAPGTCGQLVVTSSNSPAMVSLQANGRQFDPVPCGVKWSKEIRHRSQALPLYKNAQSAQMKI